ncbi:hypothetical protein LguiA_034771 [Lonicera macranthoides]
MMEEERSGSGFANGGGSSMSGVRVSNGKEVEGQGVVAFPLSPASVMKIQKGDITRWSVDGSSDAIASIHRAAGPELREACYNVPEVRPGVRCPTGEARITFRSYATNVLRFLFIYRGFRLPASHVIHTVGPVYDVDPNPEASLRNAYRNSMLLAKEKNIQYIAFTAISCGVFRYPLDEAATVAISAVKEFANDFKEVHFVLFSDDIYKVWLNKAGELLGN